MGPHRLARSAAHEAPAIAALLALAAYGVYRARFGFDFTDQGMYVAAPMRYALGDLPFRDEWMNPGRSFDILLWPLFRSLPGISLVALVSLDAAVRCLIGAALYLVVRRVLPRGLAVLSAAASVYMPPICSPPGYYLLGPGLALLAGALWIDSIRVEARPRRIVQACLAGVLSACASVAFLPAAITWAVPACLAARRGEERRAWREAGLCFVIPAVALSAAWVAAVLLSGLGRDWLHAVRSVLSVSVYSVPTARLASLVRPLLLGVPGFLVVAALYWVLSRPRPVAGRRSVATGAYWLIAAVLPLGMAASWAVAAHAQYRLMPSPGYATLLACLAGGVAAGALRRGTPSTEADRRWRELRGPLLAYIGTIWIAVTVNSAVGLKATIVTSGALLALTVCELHAVAGRIAEAEPSRPGRPRSLAAPLAALCLGALAATVCSFLWQNTYRDAPTARLTATITVPPLRGVRTTPERARAVEDLLASLATKVRPGDYLLAYDDCPLLHYLTRTRPALSYAWATKHWPVSVQREAVDYMVAHRRVPRWCVRSVTWPGDLGVTATPRALLYSADPAVDPITAFVEAHYARREVIGPFELWERAEPGEVPLPADRQSR